MPSNLTEVIHPFFSAQQQANIRLDRIHRDDHHRLKRQKIEATQPDPKDAINKGPETRLDQVSDEALSSESDPLAVGLSCKGSQEASRASSQPERCATPTDSQDLTQENEASATAAQENLKDPTLTQGRLLTSKGNNLKMLRVCANGTLVSPKHVNDISIMQKSCNQSPTSQAQEKLSDKNDGLTITKIKYGQSEESRQLIGEHIDDLLATPSQMNDKQMKSVSNSRKVPGSVSRDGGTVPTHPFFTGALPFGRVDKKEDSMSLQCSKDSETPDAEEVDSSLSPFTKGFQRKSIREDSRLHQPPGDKNIQLSNDRPQYATALAKVSRFPEAIDPIWPPADMIRVGPLISNVQESPPSVFERLGHHKRKQVQIHITKGEEILTPFQQVISQCESEKNKCDGSRRCDAFLDKVSRPRRLVTTGPGLQQMIGSSLKTAKPGFGTEAPDASSLPPCLQHIYDGIATQSTAFDRFEYEQTLWTEKYAPRRLDHFLSEAQDVHLLRMWLRDLKISSVAKSASATVESSKPKRRKARPPREMDGFMVSSSEDEIELRPVSSCIHDLQGLQNSRSVVRDQPSKASNGERLYNVVVLTGPHGCGKSAAAYAVARELGYEVFEINAGSRRSGREVLDHVGDMSRNHLVRRDSDSDIHEQRQNEIMDAATNKLQEDLDSGRQGTMKSFFKAVKTKERRKNTATKADKHKMKNTATCKSSSRGQKQSLILLEEVDVIFAEDKPFWPTIVELAQTSKRPIIMTCTDEDLLPLEELPVHGILRLNPCPVVLAVDYLLLIACAEGHILTRSTVTALYLARRQDLRGSIMDLQYHCQMALGDTKGGLEWMLLPPKERHANTEESEKLRVASEYTCHSDLCPAVEKSERQPMLNSLTGAADSICHGHTEWDIDVENHNICKYIFTGELKPLSHKSQILPSSETLESFQSRCDVMSFTDILPGPRLKDMYKPLQDPTRQATPETAYSQQYVDSYRLLVSHEADDESGLPQYIAATLSVMAMEASHAGEGKDHQAKVDTRDADIRALIELEHRRMPPNSSRTELQACIRRAFLPLAEHDGRLIQVGRGTTISAFHSPIKVVAEDIAPFVRAIVSFDLRLEEHRRQLSAALSQPGRNGTQSRRTRASRAALEGVHKAHVRKERWLPPSTDYIAILETGGPDWQDLAAQKGVGHHSSFESSASQSMDPSS